MNRKIRHLNRAGSDVDSWSSVDESFVLISTVDYDQWIDKQSFHLIWMRLLELCSSESNLQ